MKKSIILSFVILSVTACKPGITNSEKEDNKELATLFNNYYEQRLKLYPLEATAVGDTRYNHLLPVEFTDRYRDTLKNFYNQNLTYISKYDRENLNDQDKISYDVFKREMQINLEGLGFPENYIPFQQFTGLPLTMGQLGSGQGNQPFKTVKDYDDWISRASKFSAWVDVQ